MAKEAATELSTFFARMEVPVVVKETPEKGKHVVAMKAIPAGTELFEERPLVCWPFLTVEDNLEGEDAGRGESSRAPTISTESMLCSRCLRDTTSLSSRVNCPACRTAHFCDEDCYSAGEALHSILCGLEISLREFHIAQERASEDGSLPISVEAVARCVASIATRYLAAAEANPAVAVSDLFATASHNINRFVEPPLNSEFDEIDAPAWYKFVREVLAPRLSDMFAQRKQPVDVVSALLSDDTLKTILGQLTVNAQAVNIASAATTCTAESGPSANVGANGERDGEGGITTKVSQGAGMYTLQSCFNHSCEPNVKIRYSNSNEITLYTSRDVAAGEELNISYIAELFLMYEDVVQRRKRLAPYFFTCKCSKCEREVREAEAAVAAEKLGGVVSS